MNTHAMQLNQISFLFIYTCGLHAGEAIVSLVYTYDYTTSTSLMRFAASETRRACLYLAMQASFIGGSAVHRP